MTTEKISHLVKGTASLAKLGLELTDLSQRHSVLCVLKGRSRSHQGKRCDLRALDTNRWEFCSFGKGPTGREWYLDCPHLHYLC